DGTLDASFGTGGTVRLPQNVSGSDVAVQADGKIVVVGNRPPVGTSNSDVAVVRLNADGTPDQTFGIRGVATTPQQGFGTFFVGGLVLQPNGRIITAEKAIFLASHGNSSNGYYLVGFTPAGDLDPTFG